MGAIHEIVFDCVKPAVLAPFWAELLEGYQVRQGDGTDAAISLALGLDPDTPSTVMLDGPGPSICFQNVDGQRPDNNRVHFDVEVGDRATEVERLKEVGATVDRVLPTYTVMRDPEGNQFCLVDQRQQELAEAVTQAA
ncbi:VOC family protein [Devosia sp. XJ19-1]|uniref:VOC family protein n=1 Tax=Devosia ureilytica TaxID=2952754 RepID=A0A9Q4FSV5_9HYPH|nr:VOC family protein [Devosia ureilytica]MCP8883920.1 VOC family protein [Devosia ureilytica]MCP8887528.1 VOC family protein [Devosia ureilytica]